MRKPVANAPEKARRRGNKPALSRPLFYRALIALVCSSTFYAFSADDATNDDVLYLEFFVNGKSSQRIVEARRRNNQWILQKNDLIASGVSEKLVQQDNFIIDENSTASVRYDQEQQQLFLTVPPTYLPAQYFRSEPERDKQWTPARDSGLIINYSLYMQDGNGAPAQHSILHSANYFNSAITLTSDGIYKAGDSPGLSSGYTRFDTRLQYDNPDGLWTLAAGDVLTGAPAWGRNIRTGGIRFTRDFSLNPQVIPFPVPEFLGQSALPGSVELLVNEQTRLTQDINPGPFSIASPTWLTGAGTASLITTDIQGRQVRQNINFYIVNELLAKGRSDFDITLGWRRQDYGLTSDNYNSKPLLSGLFRYGLTDRLTPEVYLQEGEGLSLQGLGMTTSLGILGALEYAYAESRFEGEKGNQKSLGYRYNRNSFGMNFRHIERSPEFRDAGAIDYPFFAQKEIQAGFSFSTEPGNLSVSYFELQQPDDNRTRFLNASWSKSFRNGLSTIFSLNRRFGEQGGNGFMLGLSMPIGTQSQVSVTAQRDQQGKVHHQLQTMRNAPYEGGFGWNVGIDDRSWHHAFGDWRTNTFIARAGFWGHDSQHTWSVDINGGLIFMNRQWFATRPVTDAFALVDTDGMADIPVYIGYQLVGKTNRRGSFLLPDLVGYANNRVAIDPLSLPANTQIPSTEKNVIPARSGGVLVKFPVHVIYSIMARLVDEKGQELQPGTYLRDRGSLDEVVVGWSGEVFLESSKSRKWELVWEEKNCVFTLTPDAGDDPSLDFAGTHACVPLPRGDKKS